MFGEQTFAQLKTGFILTARMASLYNKVGLYVTLTARMASLYNKVGLYITLTARMASLSISITADR